MNQAFYKNELRYKITDQNHGYNHANGGSRGTYSEATKLKLSQSHKKYYETHTHPLLGTHMTKEQYERHMLTRPRGEQSSWWCNGRKVEQIEVGTGKVLATYNALSEACRETGVETSNIFKVCNGKRKTAGGYGWRYREDYIEGGIL